MGQVAMNDASMYIAMHLKAKVHETMNRDITINHRGTFYSWLLSTHYDGVTNAPESWKTYNLNLLNSGQSVNMNFADRILVYSYLSSGNPNGPLDTNAYQNIMDETGFEMINTNEITMEDCFSNLKEPLPSLISKLANNSLTNMDDELDMYVADRIVSDMLKANLIFHGELGIIDGNDPHFPFAYDYCMNIPIPSGIEKTQQNDRQEPFTDVRALEKLEYSAHVAQGKQLQQQLQQMHSMSSTE